MSVILQANHLFKYYGKGHNLIKAVDDVSLSVKAGEMILIMGPSGSGKTTLLSLLGGLLSVDKGSILYGDQDITALPRHKITALRGQHVGFVFQSFNLIPTLNVWENVAIVPQMLRANRSSLRKDVNEVLHDLGLQGRLQHDIRKLSGGEQQRVSIARALVNRPQLILADEPTANLDSQNGHHVTEILREIAHQKGRAVIIVSHDERIKDLADKVLMLEDGELK